jgi:hypothetical protein
VERRKFRESHCPVILMGLSILLVPGLVGSAAGSTLTAQELIRRHLASIAPSDQLESRQAFAVQGDCEYRLLSGGALAAAGTGQLVSEGKAYNVLFDFAPGEYAGTEYITDGKRTEIEYRSGGQVNPLWIFLQGQDALLTEGLLGGALTTAWALLDVDGRKPKLQYRGTEDVDGRPLHRLDYRMRKGGRDLKVRLYFEPETYHHVLSTYEVTVAAPLGPSPEASARQRVARQRVEESFADFENLDGYTLPKTWTLKYFKTANDGDAPWTLNLAPGVDPAARAAGPALTSTTPTGTFLLQWTTTVRRTARNGEIPVDMLKTLLEMD